MEQILKKAYKVWHDGMLDSNPNEGYNMDSLPVIYANSATEAKNKLNLYEYDLKNGQTPSYTDIRARRSKQDDKVMFEGREIAVFRMNSILEGRKRVSERIDKIKQYPDETMFYVQNGYVGNALLFWGLGNAGYYTDITKCQKYTKDEILKNFTNIRDEEVIWPAEHIEQSLISIAHYEKVDRRLQIK